MPVFEHVSRYPDPRAEVFAWHTRPGAFVRLTPPGMATLLQGPSDGINVGSKITLRISHPLVSGLLPQVSWRGRRGPVGVDWRVRHVELEPGVRFVDEQVSGPFKAWRHEHEFADGPGGSTVITDRVTWELPVVPDRLAAPLVEMQLAGLFAFRERQLRADLALHARLAARPDAAPLTVAVAGSSGLIGTQVCALLTSGGHTVRRLVRSASADADAVTWDPAAGHLPADALAGVDVVVNLAGHSIGGRFTERHKQQVLESRLQATGTLAAALASDPEGKRLVQASAIGLYGARRPDELLTEGSLPGEGFLADVVQQWEAAALPAVDAGVRTAFLRIGIVLSEGGGALLPQVPLFSVGLGGRLTRRDAWFSWIGLDDLARAVVHAVATPELTGPVNAVAPRPVTHGEFAQTLGRVLHRPAMLPTPAVGPTAVLGAEGYDQMIDTDQRVSAGVLADSGFRFAQHTLSDALRHALMR
ncbi:TIGR01777 family oxidoreductase [Propioniciclava soli]|uniref:TIGR01777 family oxidoreductase n=1 Tax=Propioniciclava soli TaxID=2775081 RepID=A0ABZ3C621_9ACTN